MKSKSLRPLKIILAILIVIVFIFVLDRLPTKRVRTETTKVVSREKLEAEDSAGEEEGYYYFSGLLERLEESLESRLESLGVPEEEYENISDYLSKDEIFEIETKATLASELEEVWVFASPEDLDSLRKIFNLEDSYVFSSLVEESVPSEYKNLSELLEKYTSTLTNTEDYDIIEKT